MEQNVTPEQALSFARAVPFGFPASRYWWIMTGRPCSISALRTRNRPRIDMTDKGFLLRYRDDRIVGVTVLDAFTRLRRGAS